MLARAVVGQRRGRVPGTDPRQRRFLSDRRMGAAFQVVRRETDALQPRGNSRHVLRLAVMGGAGQGDFGVAEGEALGGARFDQRKGLQGLDCRARIDGAPAVPPRGNDGAPGVGDGGDAAVVAFHRFAAGDFDEYRAGPVHGPYVPPNGSGWQVRRRRL